MDQLCSNLFCDACVLVDVGHPASITTVILPTDYCLMHHVLLKCAYVPPHVHCWRSSCPAGTIAGYMRPSPVHRLGQVMTDVDLEKCCCWLFLLSLVLSYCYHTAKYSGPGGCMPPQLEIKCLCAVLDTCSLLLCPPLSWAVSKRPCLVVAGTQYKKGKQ